MNEDMIEKSEEMRGTKEAVLARIKDECITPRPRLYFLAREWVVWGLGGISIVVGAGAVAAMVFEMHHAGWDLYAATHPSFIAFFLEALPYLWVGVFTVFAASAYLFVRHTKCGYRYSYLGLMMVPVLVSLAAGVAFYAIGFDEEMERYVGRHMPFHISVFDHERRLWNMPKEGRIAGVVYDIAPAPDRALFLETSDGTTYRINLSSFDLKDLSQIQIGDHMRMPTLPTTTPGFLDGCVMFLRNNDLVIRFPSEKLRHMKDELQAELRSFAERSTFVARSTECQRTPAVARFKPLSGVEYEAAGMRGDSRE